MKSVVAADPVLEMPFRLDSLTPAEAPPGSDGCWYRYVICQGSNEITGLRAGSQIEVQQLLDEMVERLNDRRMSRNKKK